MNCSNMFQGCAKDETDCNSNEHLQKFRICSEATLAVRTAS